MHAKHPEISKKWDKDYKKKKNLPEKVASGKFFKNAYNVSSVTKFMSTSLKPVAKFSTRFASKLHKAKWANPFSRSQAMRTYG